jgi:hypothetical protein
MDGAHNGQTVQWHLLVKLWRATERVVGASAAGLEKGYLALLAFCHEFTRPFVAPSQLYLVRIKARFPRASRNIEPLRLASGFRLSMLSKESLPITWFFTGGYFSAILCCSVGEYGSSWS